MAGSANRVILVGNLGADPEIRAASNGTKIANLSVATSETWKEKGTGQRRERTEWHRVVVFDKLAEIAHSYLKKGSKVYLEGQLQTRKWQDKDGADRYSTEVVISGFNGTLTMLDGKSGNDSVEAYRNKEANVLDDRGVDFSAPDLDDEIPF